MLDIGLLMSGIVMVVILAAAGRWAPTPALSDTSALDRLYVPVIVGLLAGRIVAASLDDPTSLRSVRALLVIRGGVEFWPGVAAALALLWWGARRSRQAAAGLTIAELLPFLLWGYASWEGTCFLREGCYGPASGIGLVPDGLVTRQFPIGLVVAALVAVIGYALRQLWTWPPPAKLAAALIGVAAVRSVASIWLPRLTDGPTRQHLESIGVLAASAFVVASVGARRAIRGLRKETFSTVSTRPRRNPR